MMKASIAPVLLALLAGGSLGCEPTTAIDRGQNDGGGGSGGACTPEDDGNPCTEDVCEGGVPTHEPTVAGTALPDQVTGDCQRAVCDGNGAVTQQNDDADLPPDDADPCKVPACSAGQPAVADAPNGTTCADGDACTQTDTCQAGMCVGADPLACAANEACTAGACVCPSGTYTPVLTTVAMASENGDTEVADLDGDDKLDLITVESASGGNGNVSVRLGLGDGTFGAATSYPVGPGIRVVDIGDIDGDGNPDLAVASPSTNTLSVYLNPGDASFGAPATYFMAKGAYGMTAGDLNADGRSDFLIGGSDPVQVYLSTCAP